MSFFMFWPKNEYFQEKLDMSDPRIFEYLVLLYATGSHKQEISCLDIQSYVIMMEQNQQKNSTTKKDLEESCKILSSCIFKIR